MVGAIVLAAGLSSRMGDFKQLLPFGPKTVIEQIVSVLGQCALTEIIVVTGHRAGEVQAALAGSPTPVQTVFNPDYAAGDMLSSLQTGLNALAPQTAAALLCLGDQPAIQAGVVQQLLTCFAAEGPGQLYIPSFTRRAGHPLLIPSPFWPAILALPAGGQPGLRQVVQAETTPRRYVTVDTPSILRDMDTPEDYQRELRLKGLANY
jgi:molybdenum cofactor cytidylyltransferase